MNPLSPFSADWPAISELLDEALGLPASEHATWLASLAGERAAHREALRLLLAQRSGVETDDFLHDMPTLDLPPAGPAAGALGEGTQVGAYRLISEIARGGMGTVWLAERADGTMRRRVALKLPRTVWGDAFAERLAREREILATLEHPHIARLYDAGVDVHGRPFLAMEYVEGEPIDAYCASHGPDLRARIALLLQVMAAVAHAHARLVVHRDLKPGNVLVTPEGQVKLLDFGIAKLLEAGRTRETALTELGGRALTLDYASPEQIRGEPLGTASDIYSMGVVAYELLAGARPYRLKRGSAAELEEAIASVEPPRASDTATDRRVARLLRGDLDSILNKALKKAAVERYATMDAFAHDLRRHLDGEPVEARPDGLAYRTGKFVRRHRLQVAAGAVASIALLAGTSVALWQAREARLSAGHARTEADRARVEAATAKAVQGFIESVFNANSGNQVDPVAARDTTARQLLDRGSDRVDRELASAPEAQLRLYDMLSGMYADMAVYDRSLVLMRRGLALATRLHGADSTEALNTMTNVGHVLQALGRNDEALAMLLQADALSARRRDDRDRTRMLIDSTLAAIYFDGDPPKGLERARSAAAIARAQGPSLDGITALHALGENARRLGHLDEARQALVDAVAWIDRRPDGAASELPNVLAALAEVHGQLGQPEPAGAAFTRALAILERQGDPESLHTTRLKLARYQFDNGLLREARDTLAPDYDWARGFVQDHSFGAIPSRVAIQYGRTLVTQGDAARGLEVLDVARTLIPPQTPGWGPPFWAARADALISLQRLAEAGGDVERAVSMLPPTADRRLTETVHAVRRRYWVAIGRAAEALQEFEASVPKADRTATPSATLRRQVDEATLLLAAGRGSDAHSLAASALATIDALPDRRFTLDVEAQMTAVLGQALLREQRTDEALPVLRKALALQGAVYDPDHSPGIAQTRRALAEAERPAGPMAAPR